MSELNSEICILIFNKVTNSIQWGKKMFCYKLHSNRISTWKRKDTILGHKNKGEREVRQRRRKANTRLCVTKLAASTEENIASCSVMPVGCLLTGQRKPLWFKSPSLVFHWSKFGPGFNSSAFLSRAAWPSRSSDPRSKRSYGLRGPTREQVFTLR